jgi:hypothetical protein
MHQSRDAAPLRALGSRSAEHPLEIKLKVAHLNFRHAHPQRIIHSRHAVIGLKLSMP